MQKLMNEELTEIALWLKANKLSLNIKKTNYILSKNRGVTKKYMCLKIDNEAVTQVKKTKFLGVIIDCNLTWKEHISYISGKIAKGVGILIKARKYLNKTTLMKLYYTFVYPYLIFCNHVWGSTYISYFDKIVSLQKKAVRIIAGIKPRCDVMGAFHQLRILPCLRINKYLIGRLTDLGKFSFRYQGASIWNEILKSDMSMESEYTFSKNLRTAILNGKI